MPAGSNGASLRATVENLPQGSSFNVCFYTGFGDMAPIVPDSLLYLGNSASVSFQVDSSSIQDVPPASFSAGIFPAILYTVDPYVTSCTGSGQAQGTPATISLRFPTLTSLSLSSTPYFNSKLTSLLPSNLALTGMNFLGGSAASSVTFNSTTSVPGRVSFVSSTSLVSTIPTTLPFDVRSVNVQVCNTAVYSYCSGTKKLSLTSSPAMTGVITANPKSNHTLGVHTLTVTFTPTNSTDYVTVSTSVTIEVIVLALNSVSSNSAMLGDSAKTITLTGTGFLSSAIVQIDGSAIATTFINGTALSAVIPAKDFLNVHTIEVSVSDPSLNLTTTALGISVIAPAAVVDFSGPTLIAPGSQIALNFRLSSAYPVDVLATFTVAFTPVTGLPDDPSVQFATGGRTFVADIPAGTTTLSTINIQAGTVAGSLTVSIKLMAGGVDVTPASLKPLTIQAGFAAPAITSVNFAGNGNTLTVTVRGFSNTREISGAKFHFKPVADKSIKTQDVTIDAQALYASWYSSDASLQYGSTCTYTQIFNLSSDASVVGQVSVVLRNTQGTSPEVNSQ